MQEPLAMPRALERAIFAEHLGEIFRVLLESGERLELELVEIAPLASVAPGDRARPSARPDPFSIEFKGPRDKALAQGTVQVEHDEMGTFDLFLVPVGEDQEGRQYEAVFN